MPNEDVIVRFINAKQASPGSPDARPDWLLDVGIGNGQEARVLRESWPWINLFGLEPHPGLFTIAQRDWANTGGTLLNVGAWSRPCGRTLFVRNESNRSAMYEPWDSTQWEDKPNGIEVNCRRLDDLCAEHNVAPLSAVLWCDVEGAELEVLRGAWRLFREKRIIAVNLEVRETPMWSGACIRYEVEAFLAAFGFASVAEYNLHQGDDPHSDVIWLRTDQEDLWRP